MDIPPCQGIVPPTLKDAQNLQKFWFTDIYGPQPFRFQSYVCRNTLERGPFVHRKNCWQTRQLKGTEVIAACLFWLMCLQETQKHRLTEGWPCAVGDLSSWKLSCSHKDQFQTKRIGPVKQEVLGPSLKRKKNVQKLGKDLTLHLKKKKSAQSPGCFLLPSRLINMNSDSPLCGFPIFFPLCPFNP